MTRGTKAIYVQKNVQKKFFLVSRKNWIAKIVGGNIGWGKPYLNWQHPYSPKLCENDEEKNEETGKKSWRRKKKKKKEKRKEKNARK